jgi:hypothetical protein
MPPRNGLTPQHSQLIAADHITWEIDYIDGSIVRERMGASMRDVDRERIKRFRLVAPGETVAEFPVPEGATGKNLMFRRRTFQSVEDGSRRQVLLVAWAPMGPAIMIDPQEGKARQEECFIDGDPEMYPPAPAPEDGQYLLDLLVQTR